MISPTECRVGLLAQLSLLGLLASCVGRPAGFDEGDEDDLGTTTEDSDSAGDSTEGSSTDEVGTTTSETGSGTETETGVVDGCNPVQFADPELEVRVRLRLGLPDDVPIDAEAMAGLDRLILDGDVHSLEGLECALALEELHLGGSAIDNLAPIAGLPALRELFLSVSGTPDIQPLATLPALEKLEVLLFDGFDVAILAESKAPLSRLIFTSSVLENPQELGALVSLEELRLSWTLLPDLSFIGELEQLRTLWTYNAGIEDIAPVAQVTGLETLELYGSPFGDIGPLAGHPALIELGCGSSGVDDISAVATIPTLESLNVSATAVADLGPLTGHPALGSLGVGETPVVDLSPLATVPTLWRLVAYAMPNLGPLPEGLSVVEVHLSDSGLTDISPMATWAPFLHWDLMNNQIEDLGPLLAAEWMFDPDPDLCHELYLDGNPLAPENEAVVAELCQGGVSTFASEPALSCAVGSCGLMPP
ncbi:hypothetical protein G6O69_16650 [Pseudenhygromyxa sp. WMMC2535]|uniref:leucine-rich repeat domain-containing protein n=1 Tax=Pseudenhygromyxa sp. WMMC2535 TaxID=2712867 RepID=UPI00155757B0|nr:hypothetical protein [Pseudenhygromyxa sp. WMMC2535]NVB39474.1 hypothetical protein [Pseudenhygromyxa sp. WMMC2535]